MITKGSTGDYIRYLMRKALAKAAAFYLGAAALVVIVIKSDVTTILEGGPKTILLVAALIAAAVGAAQGKKAMKAYNRAKIGLKSEKRVAKALSQARVHAVVHGALLADKGGDADHIIVGPSLAVIETKTGRGQVSINQNGFFVGSRKVPGNPVTQAKRQASNLSRLAKFQASAVVCVVDMQGAPFQYDGVWVCSLVSLPWVIDNLPKVVPDNKVNTVVDRLPVE